jgi:dinuclear metal center YbgI/SA1388 family protein
LAGLLLSQLVKIADKLYPFELAEPWDNVGIQIGHPDRRVERIALSLDPSVGTLDFASQNLCTLLITHHPVLLEPIRNLLTTQNPARILVHAACRGIDILSLHTNFDAAPGGLNDHLAKLMELREVRVPDNAGCARVGLLPFPVSLEVLAERLSEIFQVNTLRVVGSIHKPVERVFSVSGSGMGYLPQAVSSGADVMVTGDVRYHAALEALSAGISVIDCGHFHLEKMSPQVMATAFSEALCELKAEVECIQCGEEKDPFLQWKM